MVEEIGEDLSLSDNIENGVSDDGVFESLSLIDKVRRIIDNGDYISLSGKLSFDDRLDLLKSSLFSQESNLELSDIFEDELFISNLFSNEEIVQIFNNQTEYGNIIEYIQDTLISKINNFDYNNKKKMFDNIMYNNIISIKNKCSFLLSFGAFDQLSLFSSLNLRINSSKIVPIP